MRCRHLAFIFLLCFVISGNGCRKEGVGQRDCANLKEGLLANDAAVVRKSLAGLLVEYSEENIKKLATAITAECSVTAFVDCFECIKTLPEQTHIFISFSHNGNLVQRWLDISYSPANQMTLVGVHN